MPRSYVLLALVVSALALSACQIGRPGSDTGSTVPDPVANAISGGEIEVTALDGLPEIDPTEPGTPDPAPAAEATEPAEVLPDEPPPEPEPEKSQAQLVCERRGGNWTGLGNAFVRTCVMITRDSGKSCSREAQCESQCLARSQTCAPFKPLLGCNEVLQNNGARVTLCIE